MEFNLAAVHETMAAAVPDREALVFRNRRFTHRELNDRSRRLANAFVSCGLALRRERSGLAPFESGQDHVALYLYNGNEYLEATFAAWKARLASINVNYRYVDDELRQLLTKAKARAIVYHAMFAPRLAAIRGDLPLLDVLIQVADDSGNALLPGALDYESLLGAAPATRPDLAPSPDDLNIVFTGGTTGLPKGVLWRSADAFVATMGGRTADRLEFPSLDAIAEHVAEGEFKRSLIGPPLMHSAALWSCIIYLMRGASLVISDVVDHFDPAAFLQTIAANASRTPRLWATRSRVRSSTSSTARRTTSRRSRISRTAARRCRAPTSARSSNIFPTRRSTMASVRRKPEARRSTPRHLEAR